MSPISNENPHGSDTPQSHEHIIKAIIDPDDTHGFLYTVNLAPQHPAHPEFLSFNCPRDDMKTIASLMNFLAGRLREGHEVADGQVAQQAGVNYMIFGVPRCVNHALLQSHATACCEHSSLLVLAPIVSIPFTITMEGGKSHTFDVPGKMKHLVQKEKLTTTGPDKSMYKSITDKWAEQNGGMFFFRNLTGDWMDANPKNYQLVPIHRALIHPEWQRYWGFNLTKEEVAFVHRNMDVFADLYKPLDTFP
eukprot:scaffold2868_cov38-Cyclotella_meneghiniana.AAC.2